MCRINNVRISFPVRERSRATRSRIKGGWPGRKFFAMRMNMADKFKLSKKKSLYTTHSYPLALSATQAAVFRTAVGFTTCIFHHKEACSIHRVYTTVTTMASAVSNLITVRLNKQYQKYNSKYRCMGYIYR